MRIPDSQQALLDAMPDAVALVAPTGVIVAINRWWRTFSPANHGDTASFYLGTNYLAICQNCTGESSAVAGAVREGLKSVLASKDAYRAEYPCHSPAEKRWFEVIITPLEFEGVRHALVMHRNITIRKLQQLEIEEARADAENMSAIVATSPDAIIGIDLEGRIKSWNSAAEALYGYTRAEILDRSLETLYPPGWPRRLSEYISDIVSGKLRRFEVVRQTKSGQMRTLAVSAAPIRTGSGEVVGVSNIHRDVTAEKEAASLLRESEARYHTALQVGNLVTWITNFSEGTRVWSPEAQALFGLNLVNDGGTVGTSNDELFAAIHVEDRHLLERYHQLVATKDEIDAAYRIVRPDGSIRHVEGRARVIARNAHGSPKLQLTVVQDATDRVKREQHLQITLNELNHRTKNLLSVVQSIARRTFDDDQLSKAATEAFARRLRGIAISHDLLVRGEWTGASLKDLIEAHIEPFGAPNTSYVRVSSPSLLLNPQAAQYFGLALHELATNSSKYGVLGSQRGSLNIEWALERDNGDEQVRITWKETPVCQIAKNEKRGFGSMLLEQIVPRAVRGSSTYEVGPAGVIWNLYAPMRSVVRAPL